MLRDEPEQERRAVESRLMEATRKSNQVIESLPYHMHSTCEKQESVYAPGALMWVETRLQCPRCGNEHPPLEHGQAIECACGLHMQRFGNGLHIWEPAGPAARHNDGPRLTEHRALLEQGTARRSARRS